MTPLLTVNLLRVLFVTFCATIGGLVSSAWDERSLPGVILGLIIGLVIVLTDRLLKGFSLRAFSATTFGLLLGTVVALLIDRSGLFEYAEKTTTGWLIRLALFLSFGYIGIVLAMRSNKEDFSLIIPYVRFAKQNKPDNPLLLTQNLSPTIAIVRACRIAQTGMPASGCPK